MRKGGLTSILHGMALVVCYIFGPVLGYPLLIWVSRLFLV